MLCLVTGITLLNVTVLQPLEKTLRQKHGAAYDDAKAFRTRFRAGVACGLLLIAGINAAEIDTSRSEAWSLSAVVGRLLESTDMRT